MKGRIASLDQVSTRQTCIIQLVLGMGGMSWIGLKLTLAES